MSYTKRKWIVENTWNCNSCSTKNRGRDMNCSNCGSVKESKEEYDTSKNLSSPAVTEPELLNKAYAGPNWSCTYCKNDVRNLYGECSTCGGPKTEQAVEDWHNSLSQESLAEHLGVTDKQYSKFVEGPKNPEPIQHVSPQIDEVWQQETKKLQKFFDDRRNKENLAKAIIVGIFSVLFIWLLVWLFSPTERHVKITNTRWMHTAHLEQRSTHNGEGWQKNEPASHFNDSCQTRQNGTHDCHAYDCNPHSVSYECDCHSVSDGESCSTSCHDNGNGFSECEEECTPQSHTECDTCSRTEYDTCYQQCPTYEQWCTYEYYIWREINHSTTFGRNNHDFADPINLIPITNNTGPQRVYIERVYSVVFTDFDDRDDSNNPVIFDYHPESSSEFNRYITGNRWVIQTNHAGNISPVMLARN